MAFQLILKVMEVMAFVQDRYTRRRGASLNWCDTVRNYVICNFTAVAATYKIASKVFPHTSDNKV